MDEIFVTDTSLDENEESMPDDAMETVVDTTLVGVVYGCSKLNIRVSPDMGAEVVTVIPADTELMIDTEKSVEDWYAVCTASGAEGYCMKDYISISQ